MLMEKVVDLLMPEQRGDEEQAAKDEALEETPQFDAHILIVEDNQTNRLMIETILEELGCSFDTAFDGREGVARLEDKKAAYDLIFMDCMMPVMDEYEAMRHIRGNGARV
ncbi:MAG: response regulator [Alphaproteobacteria bacterium]|nr:response regulator [Alphaproteobacteria bacterium]